MGLIELTKPRLRTLDPVCAIATLRAYLGDQGKPDAFIAAVCARARQYACERDLFPVDKIDLVIVGDPDTVNGFLAASLEDKYTRITTQAMAGG